MTSVDDRTVHVVPPDFVATQIESVLANLPLAATKTGMLATADIIRVVGDLAGAGRLLNLVVDPVMVASSGGRLLAPETEKAYLGDLRGLIGGARWRLGAGHGPIDHFSGEDPD